MCSSFRILKNRTLFGHETDCQSGMSRLMRGLSIFALCKMVEVLLLLLAYALMLDCLLEGNVRDEVVIPAPVAHQAFLRTLAEARREGGRGAAGVPGRLHREDRPALR